MRSWKPLAAAIIGMTIGTATAIAIFYVEWSAFDLGFPYAIRHFSKWPWLSGSATVSIITALLPFYFHWRSDGDYQTVVSDIGVYCVAVLWFPLPERVNDFETPG